MKTVQQIATERGVTVQAIRKRLKRLATKFPTGTTERKGGTLYINHDAERILTNGLRPIQDVVENHVANQKNTGCQPAQPEDEPASMNIFKNFLIDQIDTKDKQISELMQQNAELIKKIDNFQMLLRNEQVLNVLPVQPAANAEPIRDVISQKSSLFSRIFKRS